MRPKPDKNEHDGYRDPESGIERNFSPVRKLAAEKGFPLVPMKNNPKRAQALQQTESGRQVEQQHKHPAQNAKVSGFFRKIDRNVTCDVTWIE